MKFIVKRFLGRGVEYDDLFQFGCMGLLKAIDRFDPSFQVQFSTYAVPVIMGEIRRCLRDDGPIHISRTIRELSKRVDEYIARTEHPGGSFCTGDCRRAGRGQGGRAAGAELQASYTFAGRDGRRGRRPAPDGRDRGEEPMADVDQRLMLSRLLKDLSAEERTLIFRRYFKRHTQAQIARDLGTSQVQVSRMESRILKKLRHMAGAD